MGLWKRCHAHTLYRLDLTGGHTSALRKTLTTDNYQKYQMSHQNILSNDEVLQNLWDDMSELHEVIKNEIRHVRTKLITENLVTFFKSRNYTTHREIELTNYSRSKGNRRGIVDIRVIDKTQKRIEMGLNQVIDIEIDSSFKFNSLKKLVYSKNILKNDVLWVIHRYSKQYKRVLDQLELQELISKFKIPVIELHSFK